MTQNLTIWLGPSCRGEKVIYFLFSSPVPFTPLTLTLEPEKTILNQGIGIHGTNDLKPIDQEKRYSPGDYSIGIGVDNPQEIEGVYLGVKTMKISDLQIYQTFVALSRMFGNELSHSLNQPARSNVQSIPLYRKIRSDIDSAQKSLSAQISQLLETPEKGESGESYQKIYQKLQEAEDYIEELLAS